MLLTATAVHKLGDMSSAITLRLGAAVLLVFSARLTFSQEVDLWTVWGGDLNNTHRPQAAPYTNFTTVQEMRTVFNVAVDGWESAVPIVYGKTTVVIGPAEVVTRPESMR